MVQDQAKGLMFQMKLKRLCPHLQPTLWQIYPEWTEGISQQLGALAEDGSYTVLRGPREVAVWPIGNHVLFLFCGPPRPSVCI